MNKDQIKGRAKEAEGKLKDDAGAIVGNKKLEAKGKAEQVVGKIQASVGDLKNKFKKAM